MGVGNKAIDMVLITYTVQERMYGAGVLDRSNYLQTRPKRGQSTDRPMHEIDLRDARRAHQLVRDSTPSRRDPARIEIRPAERARQEKREKETKPNQADEMECNEV